MASFTYPAAVSAGMDWSTPVNADIIPDGNLTRSLGSPANNFLQGNIATIETQSIQDIADNGISFYVAGQFQFESEFDLMDIYGGHGTSMNINLWDNDYNFYTTFKSANTLADNTLFQLPADNGTNGYVLQTDGAGVTSWVAAGGGTWYTTPLANDTFLIGRNQADDGDIDILKVTTGNVVSMSNIRTINTASNGLTITSASNSIEISAAAASQQILLIADVMEVYGGGAAASTVRFYDNSGSTYAAIKAPTAVSGNYTLTLPVDDGNSGQVLTTNGSGVLSWASSSGADTTLSNLTNTVAIPNGVHLLPANTLQVNLGSATKKYSEGYVATMYSPVVQNGVSGNSNLQLLTVAATDSGNILVQTGNGSSTTSGDITLQTGTAATTRGKVSANARLFDASSVTEGFIVPLMTSDPSSPADGTIWYRTDTDALHVRVNGITRTVTVT